MAKGPTKRQATLAELVAKSNVLQMRFKLLSEQSQILGEKVDALTKRQKAIEIKIERQRAIGQRDVLCSMSEVYNHRVTYR